MPVDRAADREVGIPAHPKDLPDLAPQITLLRIDPNAGIGEAGLVHDRERVSRDPFCAPPPPQLGQRGLCQHRTVERRRRDDDHLVRVGEPPTAEGDTGAQVRKCDRKEATGHLCQPGGRRRVTGLHLIRE